VIFIKVLITGGAGFIGSHIAEEIIKNKGAEVVLLDNLSVGKKENVPEGCELVIGDIKDKKSILKAFKGVDIVFHDAAFVSIRGSFEKIRETMESNFMGTLNVFEAAAENNVKKIVTASSMDVYGEPQYLPVNENHPLNTKSPYGLSKVFGEMLCKIFEDKYGMKCVALRYFNTYGIRQTPSDYVGVTTVFINQALNGKPITVYGDGNQTRDYVWVKDVAQANILAAFSNVSGAFNVGSGKETSVNQIADMIIKKIGGKKTYLVKPPGEISRMCADISKSRKMLKYEPKGDLEKILPELIEWWKQRI
jgi:UDP-glucose 4-epimerase